MLVTVLLVSQLGSPGFSVVPFSYLLFLSLAHMHPPAPRGTMLSLHCKALVNVPRPLYW